MNKKQIIQILSKTDGLPISTPDELVEQLFYGEIRVFEQVPCISSKNDDEYRELEKIVLGALTKHLSKKQGIEILDRLNEIRAEEAELSYKYCFTEGLKIGFTMSELSK